MSEPFAIPVSGLKEGLHIYDFDINNAFFDQFEESEIREGILSVSVTADRRSSHIDLFIRIKGIVTITCDRCLGVFSYPVDCGNRLLVKFGKTPDDTDPDIVTIPSDEHDFNMRQYFYEYIMLALPIQKIHPADKNGENTCDPEMLKRLDEHIVHGEKEKGTDPRWDELKKLMNEN